MVWQAIVQAAVWCGANPLCRTACSKAITGAVALAVLALTKALDSVSEDKYENEEYFAYWNNWKARDNRGRIEKTYNNVRFALQKKTVGVPNGTWYCCYKNKATKKINPNKLDK